MANQKNQLNIFRMRAGAHGLTRMGLLTLLVILVVPGTQAATLYVTDILRLGLYQSKESSGKPIKTLVSGDALEVLERTDYYARVSTADGLTGWVKTSYLVEEKPSLTQLRHITVERDALTNELTTLRTDAAQHSSQLQSLHSERESLEQNVSSISTEVEALRTENSSLTKTVSENKFSVRAQWVIGIALLMLIAGFFGGWWWFDAKQRARHGGYRI